MPKHDDDEFEVRTQRLREFLFAELPPDLERATGSLERKGCVRKELLQHVAALLFVTPEEASALGGTLLFFGVEPPAYSGASHPLIPIESIH